MRINILIATVFTAASIGGALAQPAKTECLAGAKPGGGFDLTCRLAGNALHAAKLIKDRWPSAIWKVASGRSPITMSSELAPEMAGSWSPHRPLRVADCTRQIRQA